MFTVFGRSYQWYRNGYPIDGATQKYYVPDRNGIYRVQTVFECGKALMSDDSVVRTAFPEEMLLIYPIPAVDKITVSFPNRDHLKHKLTLYNIIGQTVQTFITTEETIIINRAGIASGVYALKLFNEHMKLAETKVVFE